MFLNFRITINLARVYWPSHTQWTHNATAVKTPVFRLGGIPCPFLFKRSQLYLPLLPNLIYDKHSTLALGHSLESGGLHDWNLAFVPKGSWLPMQVWSNDSFWQLGEKDGKRLLVMNCLLSIRTMLAVLSKLITRSSGTRQNQLMNLWS